MKRGRLRPPSLASFCGSFRDEPDETFAHSLTEVSQSRQLQFRLCANRRKRSFYQGLDQLARELLPKPQTS
jgi:hypothetical protein